MHMPLSMCVANVPGFLEGMPTDLVHHCVIVLGVGAGTTEPVFMWLHMQSPKL